jgi:ferritin-like protein
MAKDTKMGGNKTGVLVSRNNSKELIEATLATVPTSEGDHTSLALLRNDYIVDAEPLGTMPPPGTLKGVVKSGIDMLTGDRPQVLLDKLGERLAFERGGTRLYDALLMKFDTKPDAKGVVSRNRLQEFRDEEHAHFELLAEAIEQLGGDPTAMTPSANLVGVQSAGLMQAINDPRTSLAQCINTILVAELADECAWEMLIDLAQASGHDDLAQRFRGALQEEEDHLQQVRAWLKDMTLAEASLVST